ncbi:unnamed protein product [Penicillium roqueforti FM164]|uniref:Genomic scaffold, ProqFM164S01 n=1 Tax=Penicillium roqueforti (strain FM164) TaxID=1365484 RepID=W6PVL0_PENRF|nr:unnamed protein product [Penicillium roqueforti FM164]
MDKVSGIANKLGGNKGQEYIDKGIHTAEKKIVADKFDPEKKLSNAGHEQLDKARKSIPNKLTH